MFMPYLNSCFFTTAAITRLDPRCYNIQHNTVASLPLSLFMRIFIRSFILFSVSTKWSLVRLQNKLTATAFVFSLVFLVHLKGIVTGRIHGNNKHRSVNEAIRPQTLASCCGFTSWGTVFWFYICMCVWITVYICSIWHMVVKKRVQVCLSK